MAKHFSPQLLKPEFGWLVAWKNRSGDWYPIAPTFAHTRTSSIAKYNARFAFTSYQAERAKGEVLCVQVRIDAY